MQRWPPELLSTCFLIGDPNKLSMYHSYWERGHTQNTTLKLPNPLEMAQMYLKNLSFWTPWEKSDSPWCIWLVLASTASKTCYNKEWACFIHPWHWPLPVSTKSPKKGLRLYPSTNFLNFNKGPQQSLKALESMERVTKKNAHHWFSMGSEHATHPFQLQIKMNETSIGEFWTLTTKVFFVEFQLPW